MTEAKGLDQGFFTENSHKKPLKDDYPAYYSTANKLKEPQRDAVMTKLSDTKPKKIQSSVSINPANSRYHKTRYSITKKLSERNKVQRLQNTYRLEPRKLISYKEIRPQLNKMLENIMKGKVYNKLIPAKLVKYISDEAVKLAKMLHYKGYKYVAHVSIVGRDGQGIRIASRMLSDNERDTVVYTSYESQTMCVVCNLYCFYQE